MSNMIKVGTNLTLACLLSGLVIAGTYVLTAPKAAVERERLKNDAMQELVADAKTFQQIEGKEGWYRAVSQDQTIAYLVPAETKGYGGKIKMIVAVSIDGRVIDYKILSHNETPGLGDNALKPKFRTQFTQKGYDDLTVVRSSQDGGIQAITGATITSRAVTSGIKNAVENVNQYITETKK